MLKDAKGGEATTFGMIIQFQRSMEAGCDNSLLGKDADGGRLLT
jgi:hypothetical protein